MKRRIVLLAVTGSAVALAGVVAAQTEPARVFAANQSPGSSVSSNWAGYAVTGTEPSGVPVSYTDVTGSWVQPKALCGSGQSFSAFWVGLGGFSANSQALEQIGTESNCNVRGAAVYDAWWEVVPNPSIPILMKIVPGDRITAAVLVQGTQVILQLTNVTRHVRVTRRETVAQPDLGSAEWIAEAPSECNSGGRCDTLPLANFGSVSFTRVAATGDGHAGTITDPAWTANPIELAENTVGGLNSLLPQPATTSSGAVPGALSADGRSFSVTWHPASQ